ncbi:HAMP domain-containing methyl-accepting chemotaxis protein [uncultured Pelagimonas sp.]|uniref:methyl-accepting chemotaxis protein n=1 Tax=uncultured Pelagimonas sp. TaxID=1618102 RepID=UPI0026054BA5|nr:HAMP domain-containing methyl-accepting chemotaxis protein [uncultured Pelagimonas sp.]
MSRFSIRTQVFVFAGTFLALLICSAGISLFSNARVGGLAVESSHAVKIDVSVAEVHSNTRAALLSVLMIDRGEPTAYDDLESKLEVSIAGLDAALSMMDQHSTHDDVYGSLVEPLKVVRSDLSGLHAGVPKIREALGHERSRDFRNRVIPLLQSSLETLETEHEILKKNAEQSSAQMLGIIELSTMAVAGSLLVSTIAGFGLALLFGRKLANPIQRSAVAVGQIADKEYDADIPDIERKDELGEIARQLDVLRTKLSKGEAAAARVKAENDRRAELFNTLGAAMSSLKDGDLNDRIASGEWDDLGESYVSLCDDFNELAATLDELVGSLRNSAKTVEGNSCELSNMSNEMSRRAEVQAATLEESAAALDELSESVQCAASRAQEADEQVVEGRRRAQEGGEVMTQAMEAMSSIAKSSEQITQIIGVIDDIAFQTNLLALNAGVEAARAGESGKGFAVVASEVRGLAQRAAESASEIKDLVLNSTAQVEDGEKLVQQTSVTLGQIVESVTGVSEMVAGIAISAREQASAVKEINLGVAELDKVTQQNAAMVGDATTSSQELSQEASRLTDLLERFAGAEEVNETPAGPSLVTMAPHDDGLDVDRIAATNDHESLTDELEVFDQGLEVGPMPLESTAGIVEQSNTDWEDQPVHTAPVDVALDTWGTQEPLEPNPVPMEPHQSIAANADQWKEF